MLKDTEKLTEIRSVFCCCVKADYEGFNLHLIFIFNISYYKGKMVIFGCMVGGTGNSGGCQEQGSFLNLLQRTDAKFLL